MMYRSFLILLTGLWACNSQPQEQKDGSPVSVQTVAFLEKGEAIANASQAALLQVITKAIAEKDAAGAVEYCNLKALHIIDSLSQVHQCQIRRVSDRYRNPQDSAQNQVEQKALKIFLEKYRKNEKLAHFTLQEEQDNYYFKPIMVGMETCLQCHGEKNKDIAPNTLAILEKLYPEDRAHGYRLKDFRGMWVIKF